MEFAGMEFAIGFIIGGIVTIIIWRKQIFRELYKGEGQRSGNDD